MSRIGTTDWLIEVSKNNIPGHVGKTLLFTTIIDAADTYQNVWGDPSNPYVRPTAVETWEIVSDNAADDPASTGAGFVLVQSLALDFSEQSQIVTMNGTTPVTLTGTHYRPVGIFIIPPTGSTQSNVGTITLSNASGGAVRNIVPPEAGSSRDAIYTVPKDKTALAILTTWTFEKNEDGTVRTNVIGPDADDVSFSFGEYPGYQDKTQFLYQYKPFLAEGLDLIHFVKSPNISHRFNYVIEVIEIENEYVNNA